MGARIQVLGGGPGAVVNAAETAGRLQIGIQDGHGAQVIFSLIRNLFTGLGSKQTSYV